MRLLPSRFAGPVGRLGRDSLICLQFYSRLPFPAGTPWTMADFSRAARVAPMAGLLVGALAGVAVLLCQGTLGLPWWIAATGGIATLVLATGALHEDGLADVADGFGGGRDRARKLEIMRDSRIGSYGTLALVLSVTLRIAGVAEFGRLHGAGACACALMAAGAASRGFGLLPLAALAPARTDGLGHAARLVGPKTLASAWALAVALGVGLPVAAGLPIWRPALACALAALASGGVARLAQRQIGGQTGDVAGAAQQVCEIVYGLALLIAPG